MTLSPVAWLILSNFLNGSGFPAIAYGLKEFSPVALVFWRTLLAGALLLPIFVRAVRRKDLTSRDWILMGLVGVFGAAAPLLIESIGQSLSSATNASLLIGVEPVAVVILSAIFLGESLTGFKIAGLASCLVGSALIVLQGIPFWNVHITTHFKGDVLLFAHGILWSLYSVIGKPVLRKIDPMTFTAVTTIIALVPIAVVELAFHPGLGGAPLTWRGGAAAVYLAVAVSVLAAYTWNVALEKVPASTVAHFIFLQPLIGVLGGVLLIHDRFTMWSGFGGILILAGVYGAVAPAESSEIFSGAGSGK
jgi:drug/metabolite transporter (DMT)-like permease